PAGWHGLLAPAPAELFLYCSGGPAAGRGPAGLYGSSDGGTAWTFLGPAGAAGAATSMAVTTPGGTLVLATTAGIYYSATAHGTLAWQPASLPGPVPPGGFSFIGMTTTTQGVAVPAGTGQHEVMITTDGGMSWQARPIG
ncbi:MAG: beta propeller repeat protein, partial [Streptosporangiaceae bacterium]